MFEKFAMFNAEVERKKELEKNLKSYSKYMEEGNKMID